MSQDDDIIPYIDEDGNAGPVPADRHDGKVWRVLIVDDDPDVHESTVYALKGLDIVGRPLQLLHAHSAAEALAILRAEPQVAVVLLDVVMETDHAGLEMVDRMRGELGRVDTRVILRTGQPGQAPEMETIRRYDINDYKTKSELTRSKLFACITAAVRSYDQLRRLDATRRGLEKVVAASNQFIAEQGLLTFAEGVIIQIAGLLGIEPEGLVCACMESGAAGLPREDFIVIAAAGPYRHLIQRRLRDIDNPDISRSLLLSLRERRHVVDERQMTLFFPGQDARDFAAFVASTQPIGEVDLQLLEAFCSNITLCAANVTLVARLREFAFVDRLLGIPNRTALIEHLDLRIANGTLAGLVLGKIDIDEFTETNDMFGHRFGDSLLAATAQRLAEGLAGRCYVARVGGNCFAVVGPDSLVNPAALRSLLEPPFVVESIARRLSVSMSFLRCGEVDARDGSELLKDASIALKRAKSGGQGRSEYFTPALGADSKERTQLLHGLHRALDQNRLFMVYQPKVDLAGGRVTGVEALMRWRAEDGSLVPPDRFIPVAERSGLIVSLGQWALHQALDALHQLDAAGHGQLQMAVNVSAVQFSQADFLATLEQALADKGVAASRLELEITESIAVIGLQPLADALRRIRARGVKIAIDDFGTGFSSLSYLDQLPADRLKIDRAFVASMDSDRAGARIARMIVPLGHQIGMRVLAEGVETKGQLQALLDIGCDEAQGFFFAPPMETGPLLDWLGEASSLSAAGWTA